MEQYDVQGTDVRWLAWGITLFSGFSMVSNLKFYSGKDINLRKSVSFSVVVGIAMGLVFLIAFASTLPEILFLLFSGYALSGYLLWALGAVRAKGPKSLTPPPQP
jgi:CDP-diacylglycerol--serine O-phosphatidyltransferase